VAAPPAASIPSSWLAQQAGVPAGTASGGPGVTTGACGYTPRAVSGRQGTKAVGVGSETRDGVPGAGDPGGEVEVVGEPAATPVPCGPRPITSTVAVAAATARAMRTVAAARLPPVHRWDHTLMRRADPGGT
jgi:hypothetical protein